MVKWKKREKRDIKTFHITLDANADERLLLWADKKDIINHFGTPNRSKAIELLILENCK